MLVTRAVLARPLRASMILPGVLIDTGAGTLSPLPKYPRFRGRHPSLSPDGKLFTTDSLAEPFGGKKGEWIVGVSAIATGTYQELHRFDDSGGAKSWCVSNPHPVFSPDGRRIYFNVSRNERTRLYVATCRKEGAKP